jgi:hypothetical protein
MTVKSYNGYVPYLFLAKFLATWLRIRIILAIAMVFMVVQMAMSGYAMQSYGAGFERYDATYNNWASSVCNKSPTIYLQPFAFTYTSTNSTTGITIASSTPATCPFPLSNSAYRLTALCLGFVIIGGLFFQSIMSHAARTILLSFALLFFSCFILDTNQVVTGFATCEESFYGTNLGTTISKRQISITCNSDAHVSVIMFDFFLFVLLYLAFECWGMCADLYDDKQDRVSVYTKSSTAASADVENPMHEEAKASKYSSYKPKFSKQPVKRVVQEDVDYTPYEPTQVDYAPYEKPGHDYTPNDRSYANSNKTGKSSRSASAPPKKPPPPAKVRLLCLRCCL